MLLESQKHTSNFLNLKHLFWMNGSLDLEMDSSLKIERFDLLRHKIWPRHSEKPYPQAFPSCKNEGFNGGWEVLFRCYRASGIWELVLSTIVEFTSCFRYRACVEDRIHIWTDIWRSSSFSDTFRFCIV